MAAATSPAPAAPAANGDILPHPLLAFLQLQPQNSLTRLYTRASSCLSIFRLLSPLERQLIMNLLWLESAIPTTKMIDWVTKQGRKSYEAAVASLARLHIMLNPATKLALNGTFKASFRQALTGGGNHKSFGLPIDTMKYIEIDTLDDYALDRWETILHYMVSSGTDTASSRPSQGVLHLLQRGGLMGKSEHSSLKITSAGFQFLLHSPHDQLWDLLCQYLVMAEERHMDLVEVLSFLFMLSTMTLGQEYSTENLSKTQITMLDDLRDYGLIYQSNISSTNFSPTRLATTLTSNMPPMPAGPTSITGPASKDSESSGGWGSGTSGQGFIVLETNYRLYAYTDNPLQTAVLNLFVNLKARFPNLVVGSITRDSVKKALTNGITAGQIISYLTTHAHPQMHRNNPLLPVTVQDQIRLWELERNRVKSQEGYLYTAFASQADYEFVLNYAKELGVVLWENAQSRCFFGSLDGHANIRGFIERRATG